MTAVAKLLPCPFCGGSNLIISRMHGTGDRYVVCQTPGCKTCGPSGDAREDAITAWNRRAALSPAELGGVAVAWRFLDEDGKPTSKWADMDAKPMHYRDGMLTPGAYPGTSIQYAYTTPRAAEAEWLPIESAPKGRAVLVRYLNRLGNERVIKARYIERFTEEASFNCDEGVDEYDEANDRYTYCAGWWEMIDNWDDFAFVAVNEGEPTHWHPIPSTAALTPPSAKGECRD